LLDRTREYRPLSAGGFKGRGVTITYKPVKSVRIDARALREVLPEIAARFMVETTTRRFCVA